MAVPEAPLVSFVVPCYNYGRYLADCLGSILSQQGDYPFEIIVVDDASTDHTAEVLKSFRDPRLLILTHKVNAGHIVTLNDGFGQARGVYATRLDADDRLRPNFLSSVLPVFQAFPDVGMVYSDIALINQDGIRTAERAISAPGGRHNDFLRLLEEHFIPSPSVIAPRELWQRALPLPPEAHFLDDWYYKLMMARAADSYFINVVLADYRVHDSNNHVRVIQNKTEEPAVLWILDRIFSLKERTAQLEAQKQETMDRAYGAQYLLMANKYFGFAFNADARRCYWRALQYRPSYLKRLDVVRRLTATVIGRGLYDSLRMALRKSFAA